MTVMPVFSSTANRPLPSLVASASVHLGELDTLVALGMGAGQAVNASTLRDSAGLDITTTFEVMAFLESLGLVDVHSGGHAYAATSAGLEMHSQRLTDPPKARQLLHRHFQGHWAEQAATAALAGGALPQESLARFLQGTRKRDAVPLRGQHLVDWLVLAWVVVRDERLYIRLPGEHDTPPWQRHSHAERAQVAILGMTVAELRSLPDHQYASITADIARALQALTAEKPWPPAY